jgi:hypothetical protein
MLMTAEQLAEALNDMTPEEIQAIKDHPELLIKLQDKYNMHHVEHEHVDGGKKNVLTHEEKHLSDLTHGHKNDDIKHEKDFLLFAETSVSDYSEKRRAEHLTELKKILLDEPEETVEKTFTVDRFRKFCEIYKDFKVDMAAWVLISSNFNGLWDDGFLLFLAELEEKWIVKDIKDPSESEKVRLLKKFTFAVNFDDPKVGELLGEWPAKGEITHPSDGEKVVDKKQAISWKVTPIDASLELKVDGVNCDSTTGTLDIHPTTGEWSYVPNDEWSVSTHAIELTVTTTDGSSTETITSNFEVVEKPEMKWTIDRPVNHAVVIDLRQELAWTSTIDSAVKLECSHDGWSATELTVTRDAVTGNWSYTPWSDRATGNYVLTLTITDSTDPTNETVVTSNFEVPEQEAAANVLLTPGLADRTTVLWLSYAQKLQRQQCLEALYTQFTDETTAVNLNDVLTAVRSSVSTSDVPNAATPRETLEAIFVHVHVQLNDLTFYRGWSDRGSIMSDTAFVCADVHEFHRIVPNTFSHSDKASVDQSKRHAIIAWMKQFQKDYPHYDGNLHTLLVDVIWNWEDHTEEIAVYGFLEDKDYMLQQIISALNLYKIDEADIFEKTLGAPDTQRANDDIRTVTRLFETTRNLNQIETEAFLLYVWSRYLQTLTQNLPDGEVITFLPGFVLMVATDMGIDASKLNIPSWQTVEQYIVTLLQSQTPKVMESTTQYHKNPTPTLHRFQNRFDALCQDLAIDSEGKDVLPANINDLKRTEAQHLSNTISHQLAWRDQDALGSHTLFIEAHICYKYLDVITNHGADHLPNWFDFPYDDLWINTTNFPRGIRTDIFSQFEWAWNIIVSGGKFTPTDMRKNEFEWHYNALPYARSESRRIPDYMLDSWMSEGDSNAMMSRICVLLNNADLGTPEEPARVAARTEIIRLLEVWEGHDIVAMYTQLHILYDPAALQVLRQWIGHLVSGYAREKVLGQTTYKSYFTTLIQKYPHEAWTSLLKYKVAIANNQDFWRQDAELWWWIEDNIDVYLPTNFSWSTDAINLLIESAVMGYVRHDYDSYQGRTLYPSGFDSEHASDGEKIENYLAHTHRARRRRFQAQDAGNVVPTGTVRKPRYKRAAQRFRYNIGWLFSADMKEQMQDQALADMYKEFFGWQNNDAYSIVNSDLTTYGITHMSIDQRSLINGNIVGFMEINGQRIDIHANVMQARATGTHTAWWPSSRLRDLQEKDSRSLWFASSENPQTVQAAKNIAMYQYINLVYTTLIEKYGSLYGDGLEITRDVDGFLRIVRKVQVNGVQQDEIVMDRTTMMDVLNHRPEQAMQRLIEMVAMLENATYDMAVSHKTRFANIELESKKQMSRMRGNDFHLPWYLYKKEERRGWNYGEIEDKKTGKMKADKTMFLSNSINDPKKETLACFVIKHDTTTTPEERWVCATDEDGSTKFYRLQLASAGKWKVINKGDMNNLSDVLQVYPDDNEFLRLYTTKITELYLRLYKEVKNFIPTPFVRRWEQWYIVEDAPGGWLQLRTVTITNKIMFDKVSKKKDRSNYRDVTTECRIFDWNTIRYRFR